jgi:hypothetical protein
VNIFFMLDFPHCESIHELGKDSYLTAQVIFPSRFSQSSGEDRLIGIICAFIIFILN